jgi:hypothetical protein
MRRGSVNWTLVLMSLALLPSCARTNNYVRTGAAREARPDGCELKVYTKTPEKLRYTEIGVVEFGALGGGGKGRAQTIGEAKERAAEHACKEGGNALLLRADGSGGYVRAIVIWTAGEQDAPAAASDAESR